MILFDCSECGTKKPLKSMFIFRAPGGKPQRLCCESCLRKNLGRN